jgi:predicted aldo/keto reductase-like oxidoreductase
MKPSMGQQDRRAFLQTATQTAVGIAVSAGLAATKTSVHGKDDPADAIPGRVLGKTGLKLPILGYGGAALPAMWGNPLSREDRVNLVRYAYDRGIRYFDTSPVYADSEAIIGEALKDRRRQVCLVTKVETTRPNQVQRSVEQSLKAMQTDHLDIALIHGTPGLEQMSVKEAMNIHAELVRLREKRIIRFIGFSAHGYFDKALALIESGGFDQCMLSLGYLPRGYNQVYSARMIELRNTCVAKAHERGMGIVAMKVVGAGMLGAWSGKLVPGFDGRRLAQLPGAAIRYALQDNRIHLLNIGMRLRPEIDANIKILAGANAYTPADRGLLAEFSARVLETDAIKKMRVE